MRPATIQQPRSTQCDAGGCEKLPLWTRETGDGRRESEVSRSSSAADELVFAGTSPALQQAMHSARLAANGSRHPVLITGPIGAGKSLLARYVHAHSARAGGPLEIVDCGAVPELDSELFGHRQGSFTGAMRDAKGRLAAADGGVIVLDDVERLSHHHQNQLHRVLVDGVYYPVGSGGSQVRVNVRFIATTNKDPDELAKLGVLKRDFLSRLDYFRLHMPGLEERREDIPALCNALLQRKLREELADGGHCPTDLHFDPECWPTIQNLRFEDHVRGLEKLVVRLIAHVTHVAKCAAIVGADISAVWPGPDAVTTAAGGARTLKAVRDDAEQRYIAEVWRTEGFNVAHTARRLGVTPHCLYAKLKRYHLTRPT